MSATGNKQTVNLGGLMVVGITIAFLFFLIIVVLILNGQDSGSDAGNDGETAGPSATESDPTTTPTSTDRTTATPEWDTTSTSTGPTSTDTARANSTTEAPVTTTRRSTTQGTTAEPTTSTSTTATSSTTSTTTTRPTTTVGQPSKPRGLVIVETNQTSIEVAWSPPSDTGGANIDRYELKRTRASDTKSSGATTYVWTGLTPGTEYTFYVAACNGAGCSDFAQSTPVRTQKAPEPPSSPRALSASSAGRGKLTIRWSTPTSDGGSAITHYRVTRSGVLVQESLATSHTSSNLNDDTTYNFEVAACNAAGCSAAASVSAKTEPGPTCRPFTVWGQSADSNLPGAAVRSGPGRSFSRLSSIGAGQARTALGWRDSGDAPYPDNPSPYERGVWYELEGGGWAIIAGLRGTSDTNDWSASNAPPLDPICAR
jgi:hypothetical protein